MKRSRVLVTMLVACSAPGSPDAGTDMEIDSGAADAGVPVPLVGGAFDCRDPGSAGGLAPGTELDRHDLDLSVFPDALCNDGTGAVIYFRPFEGEENRDRWVIQLQGGGGCRGADDCAARWCSVGTNFGAVQMSAASAPQGGIDGHGIFQRTPPEGTNPLARFNHVFLRYCSSDEWSGTARDLVLEGAHPVSAERVSYRIHFLGARILDAALATLRRDGVAALRHTSGQELPDLDDATEVVLAGASAGGSGVTFNLDSVSETLRATSSRCAGATCPLIVRGIIDSAFPPSLATLDFSTTSFCTSAGVCDPSAFHAAQEPFATARRMRADASCLEWHAAHAPDTASACFDGGHIVRNHVTTPFFLRMGLTDELISGNFIEAGFSELGGDLLDLSSFARLVRADLLALSSLPTSAEEGAAISVVPGVFGPHCAKHETLRSDPDTYGVTIEDAAVPTRMFDVYERWVADALGTTLVSSVAGDTSCP